MNHFEFYNIAPSFLVNETALKRTFYINSKKYHPDFYTLESAEKQAEILALSTQNNQAYKILNDFDKRMKYLLELKQVLGQEGENKLPQDFLMEIMELNEIMLELEFDADTEKYEEAQQALKQQEQRLYEPVANIIENYDDNTATLEDLEKVKLFYLKKRYLLRIQENLSKFAPH
ncbi:MAG: iron-sulfur cluster co-chaperone HscB C-terminal domain-containing protein [Bacteroidota bacterium]